jgi:predicted esterase
VLVFGGGPQDRRVVEGTVETDWRAEAEKRGYVVIAPMAPAAGLFFEGGDKAFPDFLTMIQRDYHVAPGKLVVAGHSNGGLSAYHIAGLYPAAFKVVIGYPGLFGEDADLARAPKLKGACMFMHVGELDNGWKGGMKAEADFLKRQGYRIAFAVEPKQTHRIKAGEVNLSARLFNEIESCK